MEYSWEITSTLKCPRTSPRCVCVCSCAGVYMCTSDQSANADKDACVLQVCAFVLNVHVYVCMHLWLYVLVHNPPVTFLSLQSSTQDRRYLGHCETPHPSWDEKQRETDSERNNEINGPHEVMTAGCPHYLMDDKCSVTMSISVPAAHLCQYRTSKTEKLAFWL